METTKKNRPWPDGFRDTTSLNYTKILKFFNELHWLEKAFLVVELGFFIVGGLQWII